MCFDSLFKNWEHGNDRTLNCDASKESWIFWSSASSCFPCPLLAVFTTRRIFPLYVSSEMRSPDRLGTENA